MKLISAILATAFLVSCGTESNQANEEQQNVKLQQITGEDAEIVEASATDTPAKVVSRIPVVNGELQHDKAEVVTVGADVETSNPEQIVSAFDGADSSENVAELDADTSSNSFGYRYHRGYRWGYGYNWGWRGCRWGCGYRRPVVYRHTYVHRTVTRAAYRPYVYGYGCRRGGYYYASYTRGSNWYSYGAPRCAGYACGGAAVGVRVW